MATVAQRLTNFSFIYTHTHALSAALIRGGSLNRATSSVKLSISKMVILLMGKKTTCLCFIILADWLKRIR